MFTGLIQALGRVEQVEPSPRGVRLRIDPRGWAHHPGAGDSISVSGCCLTVAPWAGPAGGPGARPDGGAGAPPGGRAAGDGRGLAFDVVPETLSKTTLGSLRPGTGVNLEHAVRADTLMGGHFVQGHVDGVGRVVKVQDDPADWRVEIEAPHEMSDWIVPKGSICVEGVSLTIAGVGARGRFGVALIPVTLERTTLGTLRVGDGVNLEGDIIAKTVVHYLGLREEARARAR